jgi:ribosomal protein L37AE/L43A
MLVQCKRWRSTPVGVDELRAFAGVLLREGLSGDAGIFVTLSEFTEQALAEGSALELALVDGRELSARMEAVRSTAACPSCGATMVLDRSSRGWWLRCPEWGTTGCGGKRDLGSAPSRVVELLFAG